MRMPTFFRNRQPAHRARTRPVTELVRITPEDARIASWDGLDAAGWAELPSLARVDKREAFYQAQGLAS